MKVKVKLELQSPVEMLVDVPSDKLNREDFIGYIKEYLNVKIDDESSLSFEVCK